MMIYILGGTAEARLLADACVADGHQTVLRLAGITSAPQSTSAILRSGPLGGAAGLRSELREADLLIDATHAFAARMSARAHDVARDIGIPRLVLCRPSWALQDGWEIVHDETEAAAALTSGTRVFLGLGRKRLTAFAARHDVWFLRRMVEAQGDSGDGFAQGQVIYGVPETTIDTACEMLREYRIDTTVMRNSGGASAKWRAAEDLGLRQIVIARPEPPPGPIVQTPGEALAWIADQSLK